MKKNLFIMLSMALTLTSSFMVYGQDLTNTKNNLEVTNDSLQNELDKLENEYKNFEFEIIPSFAKNTKQPILKFNTIEDFKKYLEENKTEENN